MRDATVVVQDWGGPIGLRWAAEHPDRVERLVIMNTGLFAGQVNEAFMAWRNFAERNPDLPVGVVIQGATATDVPPEVVAAYEAPWPNAGVQGGCRRSSRCSSRLTRRARGGGDERDARASHRMGQAGARVLLRLGPDLHAEGRSALRRPDPRGPGSARDRGRRPFPPGGPGRADRRARSTASSGVPERAVEFLLVGGGIASGNCARHLREQGAEGDILLVGREPDPPYNRPPLSKGYLRGEESREDVLFRPTTGTRSSASSC